ncbi:MAG: histidine kinase [Bacteroidales bacterium]|nr:histidine kinase [Bacteroidales bacterium]
MILSVSLPLGGRSQYIFNTLNQEKGLSSSEVRCVIKDGDGFIWIGTKNGLCRFDGSEIITYRHNPSDTGSICDNDIKGIIRDHTGKFWIGTGRGVNTLDPETDVFRHYFHQPGDTGSLSRNKIKYLFENSEGNIVIAPDAYGIDIYDRKTGKFENHLPSKQIDASPSRFLNTLMGYEEDPSDSSIIWFGSQLGVLKFDITTREWKHIQLSIHNSSDPALFTFKENLVRDILVDDDGKLWLATWGGGLCHLDPSSGKFDLYKYEPLLPVNGFRNNINKLLWKNKNEFWVLAEHKGVAVFNIKTKTFRFLTDPVTGEVINFNPSDILTDSQGYLWITSYSKGVFYCNLNAQQFSKTQLPYDLQELCFDPADPDILYVSAIPEDGKILRMNSASGRYEVFSYEPVCNEDMNFMVDIFCTGDTVWFLEAYDLYYWDRKIEGIRHFRDFNPRSFPDSPQTEVPYFITGCGSPDGEIWLGSTFNGIFRLNIREGKYFNYYYPDENAGNIYFQNFVFSVFPDNKGRIWYGMTEFGYFDTESEKFINLTFGKDFPEAPVTTEVIRSITGTPDGRIWLGTENSGIIVIDPDSRPGFVAAYSEKQGLGGVVAKNMACDQDGNVWVITDKGLNRIIPSQEKIEFFDEKYGLSRLSRSTVSVKGEMFIASKGGIYRFHPDSIMVFRNEIKPFIKTFRIFDRIIDPKRIPGEGRTVKLRPGENFFSIEYGAINFFNPEETVFEYMLEGLDNHWISAGNRKYVSYTNLPGGNYTFLLRASNGPDGHSGIGLKLHIGIPFYKTTFFYLIVFISFMLVLWLIHRYRMKQVRKQEELKSTYNRKISELELKALRSQMNPHFLFNSLNSIRCYVLKEEFDNATGYITKFSKLLRLILQNSRQNLITLAEEMETLRIYIEFEQMRYDNSFEYRERIEEGVEMDRIMIQPMTIQPFVENAIWHGLMPKDNDRLLSLSIIREDGILKIVIEDNGVGRKKQERSNNLANATENKSYGLKITSERFTMLESVRGKRSDYDITDLVNDLNEPLGTRVTIYYEI